MGITQFKSIAHRVWPKAQPTIALASMNEITKARRPLLAQRSAVHNGPIGSMVADLLMKPEFDYAQIVWRVRQTFPNAKTSAKSVATTARDLRRNGVLVPRRGDF